jgi:hypothetical protein
MSASIDDFSTCNDCSSESFNDLEFMRKRMHQIGAELYEKSKMLAKTQAKIAHLKMNLGFGSRKQKRQSALVKMQRTDVDI